MFENYRWKRWKKKVQKIPKEHLGTCTICKDPIYPGQLVGITADGEPVHAGFHHSLEKQNDFCVTGAIGSAVWTENGIDPIGPTATEMAARTGKAVVSDGARHRLVT